MTFIATYMTFISSTRFTFAFLIFAGCGNLDTTAPATTKSDREALQGDWIAVSRESSGTSPTWDAEHATYKLSFDGSSVSVTTSEKTKNATVVLEPTKRPKEITFEYPPHFASWGTYELNGGKLTITWAIHKNMEPNESEYAKFVLERVSP